MKKNGQYKIPFDGDGNAKHYTDTWLEDPSRKDHLELRDNHVFADELVISRIISNCRSGGYVEMKSLRNGRTYPMFLSVFNELVGHMEKGVLDGAFTFKKRGQNFSLTRIEG